MNGTVNCNGTTSTYGHTRYMTGYSDVQVYLRKAAYSDGNWPNGPQTAMLLGIRITKIGKDMGKWVPGADRWATFPTSDYLPKTAFVMRAAMQKSSGTCHNSWAGTVYF